MRLRSALQLSVPCSDPSVFLDRLCASLPVDAVAQQAARRCAEDVLALARSGMLEQGRTPAPLAAAAVLVVARARRMPGVSAESLADVLRTGERYSARARALE